MQSTVRERHAQLTAADLLLPVSAGSLARFWSQFAQLLHAGFNVHDALIELQGRVSKRIGRVLGRMAVVVALGRPLSEAAAAYPGIFPGHVVGMLRAAEAAGELESIARDLAEQYGQDHRMWLLSLPAKIWFGLIVIFCGLVAPFPGIVLRAGNITAGLQDYRHFAVTRLLPAMVALMIGIWIMRLILNLPKVRLVKDSVVFAVPLVNWPTAVTGRLRFFRCLQVLVRAGVNLPEAVETAACAVPNASMAEQFRMAAAWMRQTGGGIEYLSRVPSLTDTMRNILLTAEQAGTYDEALQVLVAAAAAERAWLLQRKTIAGYVLAYVVIGPLVMVALYFAYRGYYQAIFERFESPEWMP